CHRLHRDSKDRRSTTVDSDSHIGHRDAGKLRNSIGDGFLYRIVGTLVIINRSAKMKRHRQHACMFAGTVVVQCVWWLATFTERTRSLLTVRLVHATPECLWAETDLA